MRLYILFAALGFCALFAGDAGAAGWRLSVAESRLAFGYLEDRARAKGTFKRFSGEGEFDARDPSSARFSLKIDVGSIRLSDRFRSEFVLTEAWFHAEAFPTALYRLVSLKPLGDGARYRAVGLLTIKGRTREIVSVLSLKVSKNAAHAKGRVAFNRKDFRLGDDFTLFVTIGARVEVSFDFVARKPR